MQVTILGAGTAIPAAEHSPSGIYVRAGKEHLLFDAGAGTLQRLVRFGVTFLQLDQLFLTHFHPDHCLDVVSMLFAMRLPAPRTARGRRAARQAGILIGRTKPFTIYGPRGLRRVYQGLNRTLGGWLEPRSYRLTLTELSAGSAVRGRGVTVRTQAMNHSAPCLGYRIESAGKVVTYSGDTDVGDGILRLGQGADLLILECSMTDERKVSGHLTPTECGLIAATTGCRHLVLTHFYPVFSGYDIRRRVRRHFRGRLTLAKDFSVFRL
jgi:ribonuclease BN (tRNA processing enzyme)